ncbi:hypothetical protein NPIL_467781 [Nephila pilipes]|uniref:Uncharacterized protein n=1 Tax=Nephila pilipes TaxID=299642 RepID=A0A8X6PHL0_NEPPI|nr:hypothetical protein NPIL_467781 [Nephila pilipes]
MGSLLRSSSACCRFLCVPGGELSYCRQQVFRLLTSIIISDLNLLAVTPIESESGIFFPNILSSIDQGSMVQLMGGVQRFARFLRTLNGRSSQFPSGSPAPGVSYKRARTVSGSRIFDF